MKLKYVLLSGLFLSTTFVACTNEELTEISTPVNTKSAIALGENYTITVARAEAQTKAAFNNAFAPYWEKGDKLGAAWLHKVTEFDEATNEVKVGGCDNIGTAYGDLFSNHPFELIEGENTNNGKFKTVTNAFAGAYVLYYPYDETISMTQASIPVKIKSYETDCKEGETLKAVSENMFSYSPVKFVPGGNQTGTFSLQQVPVLFSLRFTPDEKLNMDLANGITIKNIVVIAKKGTNNVLVSEGKLVPGEEPKEDNYNGKNDKDLSKIVKYQNVEEADHLFITAKNSETDDYKLLVKGQKTKEPFIFSILPFSAEADEVTIKVVTDKGVYAKTYREAETNDKKYIAEFNNAVEEGGQVAVNVVLDVTVKDDVIYTVEEFKTRWAEACASKTAVTLNVGTPLTLDEALTCNDVNADITVTGEKLTVPSMKLDKATSIEFENELVVEGDLFTSGAVEFLAANLTAKNAEIQGAATLAVKEIKVLTVASSGVVEELSGVNNEGKIGQVIIQKGSTSVGKIESLKSSVAIEKMESEGEVTLGENMENAGSMTLTKLNTGSYTFTNKGTVVLNGEFSGKFTNEGEVTLNMDGDDFNGTFTNNAGAKLNMNGTVETVVEVTKMTLTNNKADVANNKAKGQVIIGKNIDLQGYTKVVTNNGDITVNGKLTEKTDKKLLQKDDLARIYVTKDGKITFASSNTTKLEKGYVMIVNDNNAENETDEQIAFSMTSENVSIPNKAKTVFVDYEANADIIEDMANTTTVCVNKNMTLNKTVEVKGNFLVGGDVTIQAIKSYTLILNGSDNEVLKGAKLTLGSDKVTLNGNSTAILKVSGDFSKGEGKIGSNLTISIQ